MLFGVLIFTSGCATKTFGNASQYSEDQLSIFRTANEKQILLVNNERANRQTIKLTPGMHRIFITGWIELDIEIEEAKIYDLTITENPKFNVIQVRKINNLNKDKYIGNNSDYPSEKIYFSGLKKVSEQQWINDQNTEKQTAKKIQDQARLAIEQKNSQIHERLSRFANTPTTIGMNICRIEKMEYGEAKISAYIDSEVRNKIKIIISKINHIGSPIEIAVLRNYKNTNLNAGAVIWDDKFGWFPCEDFNYYK
jgi:hypothetical protein